jgi:phosphopantothenoylcysteine decarboxylase/phosphopantothenate--cysteine ligase
VKFVVTAGPTREPLDPVRYLSNRSSGKMGYAIAAAALEMKHEVILISGPVALSRRQARRCARHNGRGNVRGGRSAPRAAMSS